MFPVISYYKIVDRVKIRETGNSEKIINELYITNLKFKKKNPNCRK